MAQKLFFVHSLTPLHAGTGQGIGAIDLPIQRERATNLPVLPGSSIKGCLRDAMRGDRNLDLLFGVGSKEGEDTSPGALHISDATLLLLPVRCLAATFVWVTCPFALRRLTRTVGAPAAKLPAVPDLTDGQARVASMDCTIRLGNAPRLVLEDLDLDPGGSTDANSEEWCSWIASRLFTKGSEAWRNEMKKRFAIVDDKTFDFLAEFATEVSAHISIDDEKGIVDEGALWYQEALPAETVLVGILQAETSRRAQSFSAAQVLALVTERNNMQFGGKATTGMGFARLVPAEA